MSAAVSGRWPMARVLRATTTWAWLALACALAGAAEFSYAVRLPAEAVTLGEPFELDVLRRWPDDHDAVPFDAESLTPLQVELLERTERSVDGVREERLRLRGWVFRPGAVELVERAFTVQPRNGGAGRQVLAPPVDLEVRSRLAADDDGELAWPAPLGGAGASGSRAGAWVAGIVVASALAWALWRRRAAGPSAVSASARARARWEALDALDPAARADGAVDVLRALIREAFDVSVRERTTPEVLLAVDAEGALPDEARAALARALGALDLARFAARRPDEPTAASLRADGLAVCDAVERLERARRAEARAP